MSRDDASSAVQAAKRFLAVVDGALNVATGAALVILTFMITIDVGLRFIFNYPLPATTEISELLMAYIVFLSLGYTLSLGLHIRITVLFEYVPARWKYYCDVFAAVVGLGFCAATTYYAWDFFAHSYSIREEMLAVVKLPWYVGKFAMPVGFLVFTLHYLVHLVELLWTPAAEATPPPVKEPDASNATY